MESKGPCLPKEEQEATGSQVSIFGTALEVTVVFCFVFPPRPVFSFN